MQPSFVGKACPGPLIFIMRDLGGNEHNCARRPTCDTHTSPMGFVDLHSHVLYGVDDGATDEATAIAMLDGLAALGITEQCVTPHQKSGQYLPSWERIELGAGGRRARPQAGASRAATRGREHVG